jgi:RHS repeat-associated protein
MTRRLTTIIELVATTTLVCLLASCFDSDAGDEELEVTTAAATGAFEARYRFTGKELDATDLYDFGARTYDPATADFLSADSILPNVYDPQQLNRYSYVRNNPVKFVDPDGHVLNLVVGAAIGAGTDYLFQVIGNFQSTGFQLTWENARFCLTNVDVQSIATAAVIGAATSGVASVVRSGAFSGASLAFNRAGIQTTPRGLTNAGRLLTDACSREKSPARSRFRTSSRRRSRKNCSPSRSIPPPQRLPAWWSMRSSRSPVRCELGIRSIPTWSGKRTTRSRGNPSAAASQPP